VRPFEILLQKRYSYYACSHFRGRGGRNLGEGGVIEEQIKELSGQLRVRIIEPNGYHDRLSDKKIVVICVLTKTLYKYDIWKNISLNIIAIANLGGAACSTFMAKGCYIALRKLNRIKKFNPTLNVHTLALFYSNQPLYWGEIYQ
jgi:hypothetical protein